MSTAGCDLLSLSGKLLTIRSSMFSFQSDFYYQVGVIRNFNHNLREKKVKPISWNYEYVQAVDLQGLRSSQVRD